MKRMAAIENKKFLQKVLSALETAIDAMEQGGGPPEGGLTEDALEKCRAAAKDVRAKIFK